MPQVIIHLGVSARATGFLLEKTGYNMADFRCPDQDGNLCKDQVISPACGSKTLDTRLDLDLLVEALQPSHPVRVSDDPGRYICNYVYFCGLEKCQASGVTVLFIHLPTFETLPQSAQRLFLLETLRQIHLQLAT